MVRTLELAEHLVQYDPGPGELQAATRCLLDWYGCALAGIHEPPLVALMQAQVRLEARGSCTVVGRSERLAPGAAALVNGSAAHVLDFDDVNVASQVHPGAVIIPAVLAIAESLESSGRRVSGVEMLRAICVGYETAERIGPLVLPTHYRLGWHTTSTIGCAASAAAGGALLGLEREPLAKAISLGLTQAGGLREVFGSDGKCFHAGRAAAAGVLSARLVESGFNVPLDLLDGPQGYVSLTTGEARTQDIDFSGPPAIEKTAFKAHAACGATHSLIDAVHELVGEHVSDTGQIESITARVHTLALHAAGQMTPTTGLEAKFSLWHTAAMAVFVYPILPDHFRNNTFAAPHFIKMRERVQISEDPSFAYKQAMPAHVTMRLATGESLELFVDTPRGRPANPLTNTELAEKFTSLSVPTLGEEASRGLQAEIWGLGQSAMTASLFAASTDVA